MKFFIAIIIITVIAIIGSRITFLNRRLPIGFRHLLFTGTEYIVLGIILGTQGLNLLDQETLYKMDSFLLFGLAWIGFLFGLQFELRLLRNLPKFYFSITAIQSFITFLIVSTGGYFLLNQFTQLSGEFVFLSAVTLGATASCTAQSAIAIVGRNYNIQNKGLLELLRYLSSVDGLFALTFFALALSIMADLRTGSFELFEAIQWLGISIVVGTIPGFMLVVLSRSRFSQQEYALFLIGIVLFCGGLAHQLEYSPLISGVICGVITANFCRHRLRALQIVAKAEKSIYIILLLILGAVWHFKVDYSLFLGLCYFILKIAGKLFGVYLATSIYKPQYKVPRTLGLGLVSEGGLVIAILLNFRLLYPAISDSLITIVVLSILISELVSPRLIVAQFDKSEISIKA